MGKRRRYQLKRKRAERRRLKKEGTESDEIS